MHAALLKAVRSHPRLIRIRADLEGAGHAALQSGGAIVLVRTSEYEGALREARRQLVPLKDGIVIVSVDWADEVVQIFSGAARRAFHISFLIFRC